MRRFALCLCTLIFIPVLTFAQTAENDLDEVLAPLHLYLQAHATGDGDFIHQAFHPEARISWVADGTLTLITTEEFADRFSGTPASDESERRRRIVNVDVTGDVASAKIELDYPGVFFTDYLTLARVEGTWKITNKSFRRESPRRR